MNNCILQDDLKSISNADLPWDKFANKTILVSGANGFLPAYMIETLLYLNDKKKLNLTIIGLVRNKERANKRFKNYLNRKDLHLIIQDVTKQFVMDTAIDYVIHAASQASPKYFSSDPVGTLSANVLGTHYLLEVAREHNAENFFYFSSGEVYGHVSEVDIPIKEHSYGYVDPLDIRSCYAESKRMGENMCIAYAHQYGLSVKIARSFHVYGPGLRLDDKRVYSDFIADIVQKRDIKIHGNGHAIRSFCYLGDAVLGFFTIILKGNDSEAYNIGNPTCALSVLELANRLITLFPEMKLKVIMEDRPIGEEYLATKTNISYPDISKITQLGWQPTTSIEEGFKKTVESFNGLI